MKGVDLSTWQTNVDYQALKDMGVEFAILRTGYGKDAGQKDDMFEEHYAGCKAVGIKVGAYLYSYCTSVENAEKEAYNCLSQIEGKTFELPIFYDLEEQRTAILGTEAVTEIAKRFCRVIKQAGYRAGVYANLNWFNNYIDAYELINEGNSIWLAQWNNEITAHFPVDIWQYTNKNEFGFDGDYLVNENLIVENGDNSVDNVQEIQSLAVDVIFGLYGNGQERKDRLGDKYESVQDVVNEIYNIIKGD